MLKNETNFMESNQNAVLTASASGSKKSFLTPRELIKYHIENPEEPITEEDIRNLNLVKQRVVSFVANDFSRSAD